MALRETTHKVGVYGLLNRFCMSTLHVKTIKSSTMLKEKMLLKALVAVAFIHSPSLRSVLQKSKISFPIILFLLS